MAHEYAYGINSDALEEEAYYQFDKVVAWYEEESLSDEKCSAIVAQMLKEAETKFETWLDNSRLGEAIANAIHDAIGEYVNDWLDDYFARQNKED